MPVKPPWLRLLTAAIAFILTSTAWTGVAWCDSRDRALSPAAIQGASPDGLGTWQVDYQHLAAGSPAADTINEKFDAEAQREVQQATWDGSTRRPWTFNAAGQISFGPGTVSEVYSAEYNTDEPRMPIQSVASIVCDGASGDLITWDRLFVDKRAGLTRLGDETASILSAAAPAAYVRDWRRNGQFAPLDINFKAWIPTGAGIELHFPEFQYGRGLKIITVPWSRLVDVIAPQFQAMTGVTR